MLYIVQPLVLQFPVSAEKEIKRARRRRRRRWRRRDPKVSNGLHLEVTFSHIIHN